MLAFDREGSGRPVLLVHGLTESRRAWDPIVAGLTCTHDVVAVDLRGHGESPRQAPYDLMSLVGDLAEVVDAEGLDRPLLVGHSLGGAVATAYAALFSSSGVVDVDQPLQLGGFREVLLGLEPRLTGSEEEFTETMSGLFDAERGRLPDDEWQRLQSLRTLDQQVVLGVWATVFDTPTEDLDRANESLLSGIKVPYLSLHGSDPGPGYATWLRGLVPTAEVEVWEGDGHYPHLVEPDRFLERLTAFAR